MERSFEERARLAMTAIQGVCFDGFGTLVEIMDKRRPFQSLIDREPSPSLARYAMKHPIGLREFSQQLSAPISEERLAELEEDLNAELNSVRLRPGMDRAWWAVRRAGFKTGICSNIALPYAKPLLAVVPGIPDALVLSFEVVLVKPQAEIFYLVCKQLSLSAEQILFVGDTPEADVLGPRAVGMHAMSIRCFEAALEQGSDHLLPRSEQISLPVRQLLDRLIACTCS